MYMTLRETNNLQFMFLMKWQEESADKISANYWVDVTQQLDLT